MSYLTEISEHLAQTRDMSIKQLNTLIKSLDDSSEDIKIPSLAHAVLGYMMSAKIKGETPRFAEAVERAESLKARQRWLFTEPLPEETQIRPEVEERVVEKPLVKKPVKKVDAAKQIYNELEDKSKENVIKVLVSKLGVTEAGAQTYYYACGGERLGKKVRKSGDVKSAAGIAKAPKVTGPTKREQAQVLFNSATNRTRESIVAQFVSELGLSQAGATTYYYACGGASVKKKAVPNK